MPLYLDPKAISELFPAGPILGDELLVCVQDGETLRTTVDDVKSRILCAWGKQLAFAPVSDDTWETFSFVSGPAHSNNCIDITMNGSIEVSAGSGCICIRLVDNISGDPIDGTVALLAYANANGPVKNYGRGSITFYWEPEDDDVVYMSIQVIRQSLESGTVFVSGGIASGGATGDSTVRIFRVG